jgi:tetratricopeptide (TPR) repeat protein
MAETTASALPRLSFEQRRIVASQYEKATQVLASDKGNFDYAISLLMSCCKLDPANLIYRRSLRDAVRRKFGNRGKGSLLSHLTTLRPLARMELALTRSKPLEALEHAEQVFLRNPWHLRAHVAQAEAYVQLDLADHALWMLEQARLIKADDIKINRMLARIYEARGNFVQSANLWNLVKKAKPGDREAENKAKDLAASATIAKGYSQAVQGEAKTPLSGSKEHVPLNADGDDASTGETRVDAHPTQTHAMGSAGRSAAEIAALEAKIKANPASPHSYLLLAKIYVKLDQLEDAKAVLQRGVQATSSDFDVQMELANLEIEPLRRNRAMAEAKLQSSSSDAELKKLHSQLDREINARELDFYRQRSDRYPSDNEARFQMAVRLLKVAQFDEAIKEFQHLRKDPRLQARSLVYLGFCFKNRNNLRLAIRNFEEAMQHLTAAEEDLRRESMYQLATLHAKAGDFDKALDLGCELANLDYSFRDISTLIDAWQQKSAK